MDPQHFRIVSDWKQNGNVVEYTKSNPEANRLLLVSTVKHSRPIFRLTDQLNRRTFSSTTTVPLALQTLVSWWPRLTSTQFLCLQLPFPLRGRFVG